MDPLGSVTQGPREEHTSLYSKMDSDTNLLRDLYMSFTLLESRHPPCRLSREERGWNRAHCGGGGEQQDVCESLNAWAPLSLPLFPSASPTSQLTTSVKYDNPCKPSHTVGPQSWKMLVSLRNSVRVYFDKSVNSVP